MRQRGAMAVIATVLVTVLVVSSITACTSDQGGDGRRPSGGGSAPGSTGTTYSGLTDVGRSPSGDLAVRNGETRVALGPDAAPRFSFERADGTPLLEQPAGSPPSGLYVVRSGARHHLTSHGAEERIPSGVRVPVVFDDTTSGALLVTGQANDTTQIVLHADDPTGVTAWGVAMATTDDEAIYGLTERIVDDYASSEILPQEVGSLDRKGETVTMFIRPTMSGYAPFFQSSRGYGLLVDGTMPGTYDLGATDRTRLQFEFELDPTTREGSFHLFAGPSHPQILDAYTRLTGRPPVPPDIVFANWRGRDEYRKGPTATWHGIEINADVARDLSAYERYAIDPGVFHFDRPWAVGQEGYGELVFDPDRFPHASAMLAEMRKVGWRIEVWVSPWAIGTLGEQAKAQGYLAPNSARAVDLTNPDARNWLQVKVSDFLRGSEGTYVDGFFMDRADEPDVSSAATDVYADGRNGRQIHNAYPVLFQQLMREVLDRERPDGRGWLIARPGYTGSQAYVMRWGGDTPSREGVTIPEVPSTTPSTDKGLRSVLISIQRAAFLGTPFWGSDIGGYSTWNDRDLYARWIEVGAVSPLMRFHGQGPAPWDANEDGTADEELLRIYQQYVTLRADLQPYLTGLAREAHETGLTPVRPLSFTWPDQAAARDRWDEWMLGADLLAAPVWRQGDRSRSVWFPPGRWVDYWDRTRVVEGPVERTVDAPLDRLPLFARQGSGLAQVPLLPG